MFASLRLARMQKAFRFTGNNLRGCSEWILQNKTLVGTLGGSAMLVAHAQYGHTGIEKEMHDFRTSVAVEFSLIKEELTKLHKQNEITHRLVLTSALKTIKGLDGDKTEMREFARRMEGMFQCKEVGGGDCGNLKNVNN